MAIGDKKSAVMQSDIVNDFTTGGAENVLSAEMGKTLAQRPNPNLLDNWYFADPIDQRGGLVVPPGVDCFIIGQEGTQFTTTSYMQVTDGYTDGQEYVSFYVDGVRYNCSKGYAVRGYVDTVYTVDRWRFGTKGTVLQTENGINIKKGNSSFNYAQFEQYLGKLDYLMNQQVTLSVLTSTGLITSTSKLVSGYENIPFVSIGPNSNSYCRAFFLDSKPYLQFIVTSDNDPDIIAVKLELGSTQTLAHQDTDGNWVLNEIPDKGIELLKCISSTADPADTYANSGFVKKSGDIMTGPLRVNNGKAMLEGSDEASSIWFKTADDLSNATFITQYHGLETINSLKFGRYQDGVLLGQWDILHTLNRPSGSYTGNGSTATRTIEINGIGFVLILTGPGSTAIVSNAGAFIFTYQNTTMVLPPENIKFTNGILTIATDNQWVNTNTYGYGYRVL